MRTRLLLLALAFAVLLPAQQKKAAKKADVAMTDDKYGSAAEIMALPAAKLAAILNDSSASVYAKAKSCQRLALVGDRSTVPAIAALLADAQLSHYARTALETIPDASAGDALRSALPKVRGGLLVGVINSIAVRKDAKAVDALAKLRHDSDAEVAKAAETALAKIRPPL